ncbi:efflux transporter outer membrane subunit [Methylococcus sp. EFPC2]|uniref:efflux transporter outer membrane subunit n=1 Tax=Methylococcus sp. EFPC2 TaxID=2812648 RepID=UPI0019672C66|nr:efflux transporter outer membrane subunit [Methylococcus sp. EFPC2]QSA96129.1 efflux transporter outer membrane subunit [Methylococcus sp. EFPC2]
MRPSKRTLTGGALFAATLLLQACAVGPDYQRPALNVPEKFRELPPDWKVARADEQPIAGNWWEIYGDPLLNELERQIPANLSLAQAEAQFRQSSALVENTRAGLFPRINGSASFNRSIQAQGQNQVVPGVREIFNTAAAAAWELDLWGRIRRQVEAGEATAAASAATMQALRLSLQSQLAQNYFQLRSLDAQKTVLNTSVEAYRKTLTLTRNRYAAGVVSKADVVQAETQLTFTEAQATDLDVQRSQLEHAIAVLIGKAPSELTIEASPSLAGLPSLPAALPSTLLERRPDIAAAEQQVIAANAQIGAARAAFFPNVTINSTIGFQNTQIERLFTTASQYWALGPAAAALPLFEGGSKNSQLKQAIAGHEATTAAYRQAVLTGLQEVEDNLAALHALESEAKSLELSVKTGQEAVQLTTNQYKAGTVSFQNVLTAQTQALVNERAAIGVQGRRLTASVLLVKALGGGWDPATLKQEQERNEVGWRHYLPYPES